MALAALIIAMRETGAAAAAPGAGGRAGERGGERPAERLPDRLIATLPFLGRTLVEHQVRQARAAGARHIVLLVERMPATLIAALDRLRRDGVALEVARAATDAGDRFHPDEAVLLIGDGVLAPQELVARLCAARAPALATIADVAGAPAFERIDAGARWAGAALVDGQLVRATLAMLGEWDAEATLVRSAVQAGAVRLDAGPPDAQPARIADAAALPAMAARLARAAGADEPAGWVARFLLAPPARAAARLLAPRRVEADWFALAGAASALAGGAAGLAGHGCAGLALFLASGPLDAIARRLARVRLGQVRRAGAIAGIRAGGGALLLAGLARALDGWGWLLLAGGTVLAMLALARERAMLARAGRGAAPGWLADPDALGWVALAAALAGGWPAALAATAGYAALSFAAAQHRLATALQV